jgi:succinate dehydrogenase / fumarate reductase membrane anchor subunit
MQGFDTKKNIGQRRLVVGAHYGMRDWLAQRLTGILMAVFTVVLLVSFLSGQNFTYEGWAGLFARQWFKLFTAVTFFGMFYHVWVGIRDIWMDYIKSVGLRLTLQTLTVLWLLACTAWTVQIIWSV